MKYAPFTTWEIEGYTLEGIDDSDGLFDTLDEAIAELIAIYDTSDSYYGILMLDDNGREIDRLTVYYDFRIVNGEYIPISAKEKEAIIANENAYFEHFKAFYE